MDSLHGRLAYLGNLIHGYPPVLSPTLDDFNMMQLMRQTLQPSATEFRILMNVSLFEPQDLEIKVTKKNVVEIRAKHARKQNLNGLMMARNCTYTYELPPGVSKKALHAQWSKDNYLMIHTTSSSSDKVDSDEEVALTPEQVDQSLSPAINMVQVTEKLEGLRDNAQYLVNYVHNRTCKMSSSAAKEVQANVDQQSASESLDKDSPSDQGDQPSLEKDPPIELANM